jgi:hypothetical protein
MSGDHPYRAKCALCGWVSKATYPGDDAAYHALAVHGERIHPTYTFPGGELFPVGVS